MSGGEGKFRKSARLRKRPEFLDVSRGGKKIYSSHFVIIRKPNDQGESRLGITVSGKVGNAVIRNRIKRVVRELFRRHRKVIVPYQDVLIIAKKGSGELSSSDIRDEIGTRLTGSRGGDEW